MSSACSTRTLVPQTASSAACCAFTSCSHPMSAPTLPRGAPGEMARVGIESAYDVASAVIALVMPGPEVVMNTPGRPLTRAYPSAA
jgi:hypothetical protein